MAVAPTVGAEVFDGVIDEILSPFTDAATSTVDWGALLDPGAWGAFFSPAHWDGVFADLNALGAVAAPAVSDSSTPDLAASFQQSIYTPLHAGIEDWIGSDVGQQVDGFINKLFGSYVIGDGEAGTAAHPDGGAGGWLLGDGGAGWGSAFPGVVGGDGGAAGIFGDGGAGGEGGAGVVGGTGGAGGSLMGIGGAGGNGGDGAAGVVGGAGGAGGDGDGWLFGVGGAGGHGGDGGDGGYGGDGGNGTGLFGSGGNGGDGGDGGVGGNPSGLPALGGAGGNGGVLGEHGTAGHFGTVAGVAPSGDSAISTTGSWLTDSDGRVVILHGLNQVYKIPPFEPSADGFSDDDAAFLAANGFNAVRLGVIWAGVEPEPGVFNDAYLASIEKTVQTLADHGIVSILDMHQDSYSSVFEGEGAPAWAVQTGGLPNPQLGGGNYFLNPAENHAWDAFWSNAKAPDDGVGLENRYAQMWEYVAHYFKDNPDVAGYEIINEPWPGSPWLQTLFGDPTFGAQALTPFYNQMVSAIRAVDPSTPLFYEPTLGAFPNGLGTVDDPHTVFSFHDYCISQILANIVGGAPSGCGPSLDAVVQTELEYASSHGVPAMMTEFGSTDNLTTIAESMHPVDKNLIGWTEWEYTSQNDITTSSNGTGWLVFDPSKPPVGDNVNADKLATLAEPYPQVVAGTPDSWSFDNGTFQFSYSTEMADGQGHFSAGTQTEISVPKIEYPNGYQVDVTGGHVVSAANAPLLVIASNGANTVNVVVSPAGGGSGAG